MNKLFKTFLIDFLALALVSVPSASAAGPVGTLGTIPSLTIGGRVFTDLTNLIVLCGNLGGAGNYATVRLLSASAGYIVTNGKTLTIYAMHTSSQTSTADGGYTLGYGTSDIGFNSTSAPAGQVKASNDNSTIFIPHVATGILDFGGLNFAITGNGSNRPYVHASASGPDATVCIYGYEQ